MISDISRVAGSAAKRFSMSFGLAGLPTCRTTAERHGFDMTEWQRIQLVARQIGYASYEAYLESDEWRTLRIQKSGPCCVCKQNGVLIRHHIRYKNLRDIIPSEDLVVMCKTCHDDFHLACRRRNISYIGMPEQEIIATVNALRVTPFYIRRCEKLRHRNDAKTISKTNRRKIRKRFKEFLRGNVNATSTRKFCDWLIDIVSNDQASVSLNRTAFVSRKTNNKHTNTIWD